jgi:hypothetical protein
MIFKSVSDYFPDKLETAKWRGLPEDTNIEGISFPKGARFKVFETANFGWVVFAPTKTVEGNEPARRIFKW